MTMDLQQASFTSGPSAFCSFWRSTLKGRWWHKGYSDQPSPEGLFLCPSFLDQKKSSGWKVNCCETFCWVKHLHQGNGRVCKWMGKTTLGVGDWKALTNTVWDQMPEGSRLNTMAWTDWIYINSRIQVCVLSKCWSILRYGIHLNTDYLNY